MRLMLANMLPWAEFRKTYGQPIATRELVKRRIARLAALIAGADALVAWGSWLIDQGYRGEMECIIAKIFGSEAQKEAAIELFMKTHGGRSFLHGHLFGDNVHEYLAPCIYEGEGEMLGMAFFKSLVKEHGKQFFEPIGKALGGTNHPNPALPPTHPANNSATPCPPPHTADHFNLLPHPPEADSNLIRELTGSRNSTDRHTVPSTRSVPASPRENCSPLPDVPDEILMEDET